MRTILLCGTIFSVLQLFFGFIVAGQNLGNPAKQTPFLGNTSAWNHYCKHKRTQHHCPKSIQQQIFDAWPADIDSFRADTLVSIINGRTLWFIGDSTMQQLAGAAFCSVRDYVLPGEKWSVPTNNTVIREELRARGNIDKSDATCLRLIGGARICNVLSDTGRSIVERTLPALFTIPEFKRDFIVVNFGLHYVFPDFYTFNRTSSRSLLDVTTIASYMEDLQRFSVFVQSHSLGDRLYFETSVAQHFDGYGGHYIGSRHRGVLSCSNQTEAVGNDKGWYNNMMLATLQSRGIAILDTWRDSQKLWFVHYREKLGDCTHSCHPSTSEVRLFRLFQRLTQDYRQTRNAV